MPLKQIKIKIYGIVQGVGFRPFVRNLAVGMGIKGSVCNSGPYVVVNAQGGEHMLAAFLDDLKLMAPARSKINKIETEFVEPSGYTGFEILESSQSGGEVFPSPDIGICKDCARELFDKNGRRYLHPFINCTACGPRLTILKSMPYDRKSTSMSEFPMCESCKKEYEDPENRRYHAQPVCCNNCGPTLKILLKPKDITGNPIPAVREVIRRGGIAAVKGIGGFHLCCDAENSAAVERLRKLKHRPFKPFAVMVKNTETAARETEIDAETFKYLDSPQKPIILLKKKEHGRICGCTAPSSGELGIMLPYAPVQMLIFDYPDGAAFTDCLVMTSGNISGEPICTDDEQAVRYLSGLCDIILSNNRDILLRADDSVMSVYNGRPYMIRRSRGYAPLPVDFMRECQAPIFAVGGELKNVFCLAEGRKMYLSAYIGDLSGERSMEALSGSYVKMKKLLRIEPAFAACDLHPAYNSAAFARSLGIPVIKVQHHFAHVLSCMAENGIDGEVIGVAFDGTGYGTDGTVWGGEFFKASYKGFVRLSSIDPFPLAGGDSAAKQCWRPAAGLLSVIFGGGAEKLLTRLKICSEKQFAVQSGLIKSGLNCVKTTSAGRLFDGVSAILGICGESTYEGEAAVRCETEAVNFLSRGGKACTLPETGTNDIIREITLQACAGKPPEMLALAFHRALAGFITKTCMECRSETGIDRVVLSGGVFANRLLLSLCMNLLAAAGFKVYTHSLVPCNDGGIALGQAAAAAYGISQIR